MRQADRYGSYKVRPNSIMNPFASIRFRFHVGGAAILLLASACLHHPSGPPPNRAPFFVDSAGDSITSIRIADTISVGDTVIRELNVRDPDDDSIVVFRPSLSVLLQVLDSVVLIAPHEPDTGTHEINLAVRDPGGLVDTVPVWFVVADTNHAPVFPQTDTGAVCDTISIGTLHEDTLLATDPDGDSLLFVVVDGPAGLGLADSLIRWQPRESDIGDAVLLVSACDGFGACDTTERCWAVSDTNHPATMIFDSADVRDTVRVGHEYARLLAAVDPDSGDTPAYSLDDTLEGMVFADGLVQWIPEVGDIGDYPLVAYVTDGRSGLDSISWVLTVVDTNHPPRFAIHDSLDTARVGREYLKQLVAADPDSGDSLTYALPDTVEGMSLNGSIAVWTPEIGDTGRYTLTALVRDSSSAVDSMSWVVTVLDTNHRPYFVTEPSALTDTLHIGDRYTAVFRARDDDGDSLVMTLVEGDSGIVFSDSSVGWVPAADDIGENPLAVSVADPHGATDTLVWTVHVLSWPAQCPPYTHKNDGRIVGRAGLPSGFVVYSRTDVNGMYKSYLREDNPIEIGGVDSFRVTCIDISDDGQWILFLDRHTWRPYLITRAGEHLMQVPVDVNAYAYPREVGWLRQSPYGTELYYFADSRTLKAMRVYLESDTVYFGEERILIDLYGLDPKWRMVPHPTLKFGVAGDQVFGRFENWESGERRAHIEFCTIPLNGRGTAGLSDIYRWKADAYTDVGGCGFAMSFDGALCVSNAPYIGLEEGCLPVSHKGFVITPFRRVDDPGLHFYHEHFMEQATSLNFCPAPIRPGAEFWGWEFGNRNDLLIGHDVEPGSGSEGLWMVDWESNAWTRLTSRDEPRNIRSAAVYFGNVRFVDDTTDTSAIDTTDTTSVDPLDPHYRVVYPNGGETFSVGEVCSVKVTAESSGRALLRISLHAGQYEFFPPGITGEIDPLVDTLSTFVIPPYFVDEVYNTETNQLDTVHISTVSDSCLMIIQDYDPTSGYVDYSDGYFRITE